MVIEIGESMNKDNKKSKNTKASKTSSDIPEEIIIHMDIQVW